MTGDQLSVALLAFYIVLAGVYAYEGQYWKVLYWISAAGIVTAVWGMK